MRVEELYREIRALRIYEGASEVQQLIIGNQTLQRFGEGRCGAQAKKLPGTW
jgi:acyl-CoA dehydrogenase